MRTQIKTRHLVRTYVIVVPLWAVIADLAYLRWTHNLNVIGWVFLCVRSVILYLITIWIIRHLVQRQSSLRRQYQELVDIAPQPIFIQQNQKWVYANAAALTLIGAQRLSGIIGHSIWEITLPDDRDIIMKHIQMLQHSTQSMGVITDRKLIRLDGEIIDVELVAAPVQFNGMPEILLLYTDVTEKKRMETELQTAITELEAFIEHNTDAIAIFDLAGNLTKANKQFEVRYGFAKEDLLGQKWRTAKIIPEQHRPEAEQLVKQILQDNSVEGRRTVRQTSDGTLVDVSISGFSIRDKDNRLIGGAVTWRDISDYVQSQERLIHSETLAAVGKLAASMAHEIRNPLTAALGLLQMAPSSSPGKQVQYMDIVSSELQRIAQIVTQMLSVAKPHDEEFGHVNISKLVDDMYQFMQPNANMHGVEFITNVSEPGPEMMVYGDENRLKQVLINLVRNAIDAVSKSHSRRKVTIVAESQDETVLITMSDNGVGMTEDQIRQITAPFYTTKDNGTGLGLYICQQIIEGQHHGKLWFESVPNVGTKVYVSFPSVRSVT